jgi:hypothetical protein
MRQESDCIQHIFGWSNTLRRVDSLQNLSVAVTILPESVPQKLPFIMKASGFI